MKCLKAGRELIDFIKLCYAAQRSPLLMGKPGVGKSEILEQAAQKLGIGFICRDLSIMEPPDLVGMPKLDGQVTHYLPPAFLPTGDSKGLLVFEELNRCPPYMRAPCLQLLTARTLNDYTLPKGWLPAAAINPPNVEYETQELDPALLSRFTQATIVPDSKEWLSWAQANGLHPDVLAYVAHDATIFDEGMWSNPRAWKAVSDLLLAWNGAEVSESTLKTAIAGTVGPERAVAFLDFRKQGGEAPPEAEELLSNYLRHRDKVKSWVAQGRIDLLDKVASSLKLLLQASDSYDLVRADMNKWKNLASLLDVLPADLAEDMRKFLMDHGRQVPRRRGQCS